MLTVLMIDDDAAVTKTVKDHAEATIPGISFRSQTDFDAALQSVKDTKPDVLILDVYRGSLADGDVAAQPVWSEVWKDWFCPLVFYSAGVVAVTNPAVKEGHPFIRTVVKGGNTEQQVISHIQGFAPHIEALHSAMAEMERLSHIVLRDVSATVFRAENDDAKRREMLIRAARRRVAAQMDELSALDNTPLFAWEQYIFPVLTSHPVTGDILRIADDDATNPASYRVLLTPTCDMVPQASGCKVSHALVAKCCDPAHFVTKGLSIPRETAKNKVKDKLPRALTEPHQSGLILLPECTGVLPLMAVNLRELELVPMTDIVPADAAAPRLLRVASLDSPFREFVGWAFLQISCRPGVPPRDTMAMIDGLLKDWSPPATDGKE